MDTYGSRSLVIGGMAVVAAAERVVEKAKVIAAHMLEADPADLEFKDGAFGVKGSPGSTKTIQEVAFEAFTSHDLPDGAEPTLQANSHHRPARRSRFPHGTHLCAVEVDTETGMTKIRKYVCVDDIGKVVNPMIVEGQVHGGIAQGIAQALYEEAVYDDDGNLVTGTLVDYLVPAAPDLPHFDDRPHRDAGDHEPVGRQGCRRGRHHRVDARRSSTRSSTRCGSSASTTSGWRCTPERVWRAIHERVDGGGDAVPRRAAPSPTAARRPSRPREVRQ